MVGLAHSGAERLPQAGKPLCLRVARAVPGVRVIDVPREHQGQSGRVKILPWRVGRGCRSRALVPEWELTWPGVQR